MSKTNHTYQNIRLPRVRTYNNKPILIVIFVTLAVFVITSGIGLALLVASQHGSSTNPQVTPANKSPLPSNQSPQQLYSRITATTPSIDDSFSHEDMMLWLGQTAHTQDSSCAYNAQGLTIQASSTKAYFPMCYPASLNLSNFAIQVKMTIFHSHEAGLLLRFNINSGGAFCAFSLDQGGSFSMTMSGNPLNTLLHRPDPAIKAGPGQSNVVTAIAQGNTILVYANSHYLGQIINANLPSYGSIGFVGFDVTDVPNGASTPVVTFSGLRIWKL